ncbi:MAG TPA: serine protease [Steroidobacteraceae bacterium]|nr:serine protease [Steroidobacteraceae bacterium]
MYMKRWSLTALLCAIAFSPAFGETLDSSVQRRLREATFEVVLGKPDADPLSYEKPLPLDLLPFAERTAKYKPLGTAFAIGGGRFATAAHVIAAGCGSQFGPVAIRDAGGKIHLLDRILKYSEAEDYAVFTVKDSPRVTALETHDRPALNEPVFAVGNAYGEGIVIRDGLYTSETPEEREGRWKWLRFSAAASPGNSGGPLVDRRGRVIGVVLRKSPSENLNVAVAIDQVLKGSDEWASFESRFAYRFPMMRASDATDASERFSLSKPIAEFCTAAEAATKDAFDKARSHHQAQHGAHMFPRGAESQPLLYSLYVSVFPRSIEERTDGAWGVSDPKPQRSELDQKGYVETAPFPGATLVRLRMPDEVKWADLYTDSKLFMDLVLKGMPIRRAVGSDSVRVTSLGKAAADTTFSDTYGRTWQVRTWQVPYNDSVVVSIALPTPQGYVAIVAQRPTTIQAISLDELRSLTGFVYLSYAGTLKQWRDYLTASLDRPGVLRSLDIQAEYGKNFRYRSKRFNLVVPSSVQKIDADSNLIIKFSYYADGDATVWDVGGLYLEDAEFKGKWIDVLRYRRPPAGLPESFAERWHAIETGGHPYTGVAYSTNGGTRINSVDTFKGVGAARTSIVYSLTVTAEGTQDQATMKRALDTLQAGMTLLEHD